RYAQRLQHQAQRALVLIRRRGLIPALGERADDRPRDLPAAVSAAAGGLIPPDDQETVLLELRALDQRIDVGLEPLVGGSQCPVVSVVVEIRRDEGKVRQRPVRQVGGETRKGHHVRRLPGERDAAGLFL